jgi:RHS repeat-associated protein
MAIARWKTALASATDVKGEYVYLGPDGANDNPSPFGGDDGMGGYGLLAVGTRDAGNNPVVHWIHSNHLGAPMVTTDSSGTVIAPGSYTQPMFPGQMRTHADLYYNRYRDYDPTTGHYIQVDPIGLAGGSNPYLYANGNPVRYVDPDGKIAFLIPLGITAGRVALQCAINPACRTAVVAAVGGLIYEYNNHVALPDQYRGGICFFRGSHGGGRFGNGTDRLSWPVRWLPRLARFGIKGPVGSVRLQQMLGPCAGGRTTG